MRVTLTGRKMREWRGSTHVVVGQVIDLPEHEARKLFAKYPSDFVAVDENERFDALHAAPFDMARLRGSGTKVGVLVTTYNGREMTERCLHSLEAVSGVELDLYVVDNCSTDGTRQWLARNGVPFEQPIGRCSVAEALNRGADYLMERGAEWLLVLNNDVIISGDYVRRLLDFAEADKTIGWVVGISRSLFKPQEFVRPEDIDGDHLSGDSSATLFRVEALREVGLWDERFTPRYGEDEDMITRFGLAGWKCWRLPVPYDGKMGGVFEANAHEETQADSYRRSLRTYIAKWGDAPRSAKAHAAKLPDILDGRSCDGYDKSADCYLLTPPVRREPKDAAIVQNGHIGDVLLTFPMAEELKRRGFTVTWYAVPPYTEIAKLCPDVDRVIDTEEMVGLEAIKAQPFERASRPGKQHAEQSGANPIVLAQIAPESQTEYLSGDQSYIPFMYERSGFGYLKSWRPKLVPEPRSVREERDAALPKQTKPRVLLNLRSESAPIRVDWKWWVDFAAELDGIELVYSEHPGFEWRGTGDVIRLKPFNDVRCVPYMAQGFELVITTSTAPLWSAYAHNVPAICLLPRNPMGRLEEGRVLKQNSMVRCGVTREWEAMDVVVGKGGDVEKFLPVDLARIVMDRVHYGHDLRAIHAETYGDLFKGYRS